MLIKVTVKGIEYEYIEDETNLTIDEMISNALLELGIKEEWEKVVLDPRPRTDLGFGPASTSGPNLELGPQSDALSPYDKVKAISHKVFTDIYDLEKLWFKLFGEKSVVSMEWKDHSYDYTATVSTMDTFYEFGVLHLAVGDYRIVKCTMVKQK